MSLWIAIESVHVHYFVLQCSESLTSSSDVSHFTSSSCGGRRQHVTAGDLETLRNTHANCVTSPDEQSVQKSKFSRLSVTFLADLAQLLAIHVARNSYLYPIPLRYGTLTAIMSWCHWGSIYAIEHFLNRSDFFGDTKSVASFYQGRVLSHHMLQGINNPREGVMTAQTFY